MKMRIFLYIFLLLTPFLNAQKVKIAAAANVRYALEEIKKQYIKRYPDIKLEITYGSSGNLVQQILNGAEYDLFISADNKYPLKLKEKGMTQGDIKTYSYGKLVLWSSTINLKKGLQSVLNSTIKKIAIANPATAPYGKNTVDLLKKEGLYSKISSKIVWGENISQTAQFAYSGNAEIGFISLSLALAPSMKKAGSYYLLPENISPFIQQDCVLLKSDKKNAEAVKFLNYMTSTECNSIWTAYGYGLTQ